MSEDNLFKQPKSKTQPTKPFPSPLQLFERKFCRVCKDSEWCKPNELRMQICVWCGILDAKLRNDEINKQRGAHY